MANKRKDHRKQTQRQQEAATPKCHPRGLARSIAKYIGGGDIPKDWREIISKLPRTGRKYLRHPEKEAKA